MVLSISNAQGTNLWTNAHNVGLLTQVVTLVTWISSAFISVYFHDRIWEQNYVHQSLFTLDHILGDMVGLFVIQSAHLAYDLYKTSPVGVGVIHFQFILNNVFHLAFILLLVNSFFVAAELVLLLNLVNLRILYFRHPVCRLLIRTATMSGPLAWTIVAMYWNGSMMVPDPISTACRVASQISTWGIFACGVIFAFAHQDCIITYSLSLLSGALGVAQLRNQLVPFQWVSSFTVTTTLYVITVVLIIQRWKLRMMELRSSFDKESDKVLEADKAETYNYEA
ncbi:DUF1774 domain protein [Metarhizium robertsii]|uniref:DUF1774 domain protein n=1 Tax=Metarhizium robertsii TaxID=568076 RepID=A0A014P233_9HYPO|nr:DUF1774 domain protein [Metarhizium robertsii]